MRNELDFYDPRSNLEEISIDLLSSSSTPKSAIAKVVGDFTSALAKPITDWKKLDKLETLAIILSRRSMEVRKDAIKAIKDALANDNLSPEAQERAIDALLKLGLGEG